MGTSLILEGGGYRGQFTSGVLDVFMERNLEFDAIYAVSAGSLNAMSYLSHQIGRACRVNLAFRDDKRYMGLSSFMATGSIVSPKFMYQIIQDEIDPFDYDTFRHNAQKTRFHAVVSNVSSAQAEYPVVHDLPHDIDWVRASATLPMVSKKVKIGDAYYLDGGICDPIPLERSLQDGYRKHVVVLTQHKEFIKRPYSYPRVARFRYEEFPHFLKALECRHEVYNRVRDLVFKMEAAEELVVICPPSPVTIKRIEHGGPQLLSLYIQGRQQAERSLACLESYLS